MSGPAPGAMREPRKRNSTTSVCNFCRRRKVRCDRGQPCSACVKYGNRVCEYSSGYTAAGDKKPEKHAYGESILRLDLSGPTTHPAPHYSPPNDFSRPAAPPAPFMAANRPPSSASSQSNSISSILNPPSSSTSATFPAPAAPSSVYEELESLRNKLQSLEKTVAQEPPQHSPRASCPIWVSPTGDSLDTKFCVGNNPYLSSTQTYSFHECYVPLLCFGVSRYRHHDPLSWISLINIDAASRTIFDYKVRDVKRKHMLQSLKSLPSGPSERIFANKLRDLCGSDNDDEPSGCTASNSETYPPEQLRKINERARSVGLTVYDGNLDSLSLVEKALALLPTQDVLWLLIERFFSHVYPFFPFLDQNKFETSVTEILGGASRDPVKVQKLHISHKSNLFTVGILLLVLRFGYLTLFTLCDSTNEKNLNSDDPDIECQKRKFLLQNPIDTNVFAVADEFSNSFGPASFSTFEGLQLSLLLRTYQSHSPENSEGAADLNSTGVVPRLIDVAMSLGLHREPTKFRAKLRDEATNNLGRKIWWHLIIIDIAGALTNGSRAHINKGDFDTRPPFYVSGNENIRDVRLEQETLKVMQRFELAYDGLYSIVMDISDVRTPVNMENFCQKLSKLEVGYFDELKPIPLGVFESLNNVPSSSAIDKAVNLKIGIMTVLFTASVSLHFFNLYESTGEIDLAYYYFKKIISIAVHNIMPFYDRYLERGSVLLGDMGDFFVTPSALTLVHKVSIIIHCMLLRDKFSVIRCESLDSHLSDMATNPAYKKRYDLLVENIALGEQCLSTFFSTMKRLGNRYYYAWRYTKAHEKLHSFRNRKEYFTQWSKGKEAYTKFSDAMLEDLNSLLRRAFQWQKAKPEQESDPKPFLGFANPGEKVFSDAPDLSDQSTNGYFSESDELWMSMLTGTNNDKTTNMSELNALYSGYNDITYGTAYPGYWGDFTAGNPVIYDEFERQYPAN